MKVRGGLSPRWPGRGLPVRRGSWVVGFCSGEGRAGAGSGVGPPGWGSGGGGSRGSPGVREGSGDVSRRTGAGQSFPYGRPERGSGGSRGVSVFGASPGIKGGGGNLSAERGRRGGGLLRVSRDGEVSSRGAVRGRAVCVWGGPS